MFDSLSSGFNFLKKKSTLILTPIYFFILILGLTFYNVIYNTLLLTGFFDIVVKKAINYPIILNSIYGVYFWLCILVFFLFFFLFNFIYYNISRTNSEKKNKESLFTGFKKVLIISLIAYLSFMVILILGLLLLSYINIITFILFIFLLITSFVLMLLYYLAIICSGLNNFTVKQSLSNSWILLKNKFWQFTAFTILLYLIIFFIIYVFSIIVDRVFYSNYTAALVFGIISVFFAVFYLINSLSIFTKKFI